MIFTALIPLVVKAYDVRFYSTNDILFYDPTDTGMKDPDSNPTFDANKALLAKLILQSRKVSDDTGQLQQIADGFRTDVDRGILIVLLELSKTYYFSISSLKRDYALPYGAGENSLHLIGRAVDIYSINKIPVTYGPSNQLIQAFIYSAAPLLLQYSNGSCWIGNPDPANGYRTGNACTTNFDKGNGAHVHLDIGGGSDTTLAYDSSPPEIPLDQFATTTPVTTTGIKDMLNNGNLATIYNFYTTSGLTPAQAAGIAGNFWQESGFDPEAHNNKLNSQAIGIAQWLGPRKTDLYSQYPGHTDTNPPSIDEQLKFSWWELTTPTKETGAYTALTATTTPAAAARSFYYSYERAADNQNVIQTRINNAIAIYNFFISKTPIY